MNHEEKERKRDHVLSKRADIIQWGKILDGREEERETNRRHIHRKLVFVTFSSFREEKNVLSAPTVDGFFLSSLSLALNVFTALPH